MTEINTVMSWLEGLTEDDWRAFHSDSEVQNIAKEALRILDEQAVTIENLRDIIKIQDEHITDLQNEIAE